MTRPRVLIADDEIPYRDNRDQLTRERFRVTRPNVVDEESRLLTKALAILNPEERQGKCCKPGHQLRDVLQPVSEDYVIFNKRAKAIEIVARLVLLDPSN